MASVGGRIPVAVAGSLMWYDVTKERLQVGDHVTLLLDAAIR